MKKFWVLFFSVFVAIVVSVSMIFVVVTRETISLSAEVMYVNVGDEFSIDVIRKNPKKTTSITNSTNDTSIVDFSSGLFVAKAGGVARVTFTTTNSRYRNLFCDVLVGDGSIDNPYYISEPEQLAMIGRSDEYPADACYKLVANLDMSNVNNGFWAPINEFSGILDGNGFTISNIDIDKDSYLVNNSTDTSIDFSNGGLINTIAANGKVYNLKLANYYAVGEFDNFGTIAAINYGLVERIEIRDAFLNVTADAIGGVVGKNISTNGIDSVNIATISKCSSNVIIGQTESVTDKGVNYEYTGVNGIIGGIAAKNIGGKIDNTYAIGRVYLAGSKITFGGIVGDNQFATLSQGNSTMISAAIVCNSYSAINLYTAKVDASANETIGGVIGQNLDAIEIVTNGKISLESNTNNLSGLYYNKENLNVSESATVKRFAGVGRNMLADKTVSEVTTAEKAGFVQGLTSANMRLQSSFVPGKRVVKTYSTTGNLLATREIAGNWDFGNVWNISTAVNNGFPTLTYTMQDDAEDGITTDFEIVNAYEFVISQGDINEKDAIRKIATIVVKDSNNKVVASTNSASYALGVAEGFRVNITNNSVIIYNLDGKAFYTITFENVSSNYKFNSFEINEEIVANNNVVNGDTSLDIWFRSTRHNLTIIDATTGKTKLTATVTEGESIASYINTITKQYSSYAYIRFATNQDGTGIPYYNTSKMPNENLTIYVIYSNNNNPNYTPDTDVEGDYIISDTDSWNEYVVNYGDNENLTFALANSFTVTSKFLPCENFAGTFNGNGYTIIVKGTLYDFALFDQVADTATINNLTVKYSSPTVRSLNNSNYFGGIANESCGFISDCEVSGTINFSKIAKIGVAGIVGNMQDGQITNCDNSANITAKTQFVAGIVANFEAGTITDCNNIGNINNTSTSVDEYDIIEHGTVISAGIVGLMNGNSRQLVEDCNNRGKITCCVSGSNNGGNAAGIVGYLTIGTVQNNSNSGTISSNYQSAGIVAMMTDGYVKSNINSGNISAITSDTKCNALAGGVVGKVYKSGTITNNTHSTGEIVAKCSKYNATEAYAGGIIGAMFNGGKATNNKLTSICYISATGVFTYAAGGCGRVISGAIFSTATFPANWSSIYSRYVTSTCAQKGYKSPTSNNI